MPSVTPSRSASARHRRSYVLVALRRRPEQPQPCRRQLLPDQRERGHQRLQVLQRIDPADPADRRHLGLVLDLGVPLRLDPVVDRHHTRLIRPEPVLPPSVEPRHRYDEVRRAVAEFRQLPEEAEHDRLDPGRVVQVAEGQVPLPQVDTVLRHHQRSTASPLLRQRDQGRQAVRHRVAQPQTRTEVHPQRQQRSLDQLGRHDRVVHGQRLGARPDLQQVPGQVARPQFASESAAGRGLRQLTQPPLEGDRLGEYGSGEHRPGGVCHPGLVPAAPRRGGRPP